MENKTGKRKVIIISVIAVLVIATAFGVITSKKPKQIQVSLAQVSKKNLVQTISVTGNIEAKDRYEVNLSSAQKVAAVYVKEGQQVKKGDILVKMDTSDLDYQLKKAQLSLDMTSITGKNSSQQAEINYDNAKRAYEDANTKFVSNQELYNNGYISKQEYDASKKTLEDAANQVKLAEIQLQNADTASAFSSTSKQLDMTRADIENLKKKIADSSITSDIDGKVVQLDAKLNQNPKVGDKIVICDTSLYKVKVQVSQYDAVNISTGQKAAVKVKGLDKIYNGTVTRIGQLANITNTGTDTESKVDVEITINNPDSNIKVGYEVDANIIVTEKNNVASVGFEAVKQDSNGRKYVFAAENNKAVKKYIETGLETDFDIEVISGLKEGDKYIPNPPETLKEGQPVTVSGGKK